MAWLVCTGLASAELVVSEEAPSCEPVVDACVEKHLKYGEELVKRRENDAAGEFLDNLLLTIPHSIADEIVASIHVARSAVDYRNEDMRAVAYRAEQALALTQGLTSVVRANAIGLQVIVLSGQGLAADTLVWLEEELSLRRRLPVDEANLPNALINVAITYAELGHLATAEEYLQEALENAKKYDPRAHTLNLIRLNLGYVYGQSKEYARAAEVFQDVVTERRKTEPGSMSLANALSNLGQMQFELHLMDDSLASLTQAKVIQQKHGPLSISMARTQVGLGRIAAYNGNYSASVKHALLASKIVAVEAPNSLYTIISDSAVGRPVVLDSLANRTDIESAVKLLVTTKKLAQRISPCSGEFADVLYLLGKGHQRMGDVDEALLNLQNATEVLDCQYTLIGEGLFSRAIYAAAFEDLYKSLADLKIELGQPLAALQTIEHYRARTYVDSLNLGLLLEGSIAGENYLTQRQELREQSEIVMTKLQQLSPRDEDLSRVLDLQAQLASFIAQDQDLIAALLSREPRFKGLLPRLSQLSSELSGKLAVDERLVYFLLGDSRSSAIVFGANIEQTISHHWLPSRAVIEAQTDRLRILLQNPHSGIADYEEAAKALWRSLFKPLETSLKGVGSLVIVPEGRLFFTPFAALMDEKRGEYLIERFGISMERSLAGLRDSGSGAERGRNNLEPLRFAGFAYGGSKAVDSEKESLLPHAAEEVQMAASFLEYQPQLFVDSRATESALKALTNFDILHFATHAVVDMGDPMRSYISLAADDSEDGQLMFAEIVNEVNLQGQFVVLSACETAKGPLLAGEGVIGMAKAFSFAGAEGVVGTLWPVVDSSTSELMSHYYKALAKGFTPVKALAVSQKRLLAADERGATGWFSQLWQKIAGPNESFNHPYYWAPFVVMDVR